MKLVFNKFGSFGLNSDHSDRSFMSSEQLWQAILGELELSLSKANFTTWFKNTFIISREDGGIIVAVPNAFTKTWMENKYNDKILEALKHITQNQLNQVFYRVQSKQKQTKTLDLKQKIDYMVNQEGRTTFTPVDKYGLNPKYTFDKFVVGKNNELAHAAAKAIVKQPGTAYNPLFVYGGVGLGKTHLIQAIGHELIKSNPDVKLIYATSEKFTNEFINSLRNNRVDQFCRKYRQVDVLIIDDIQFMAGKEQTQEQFFHTFNDLHQAQKQIILSSDRPPKAIQIESRLQSRLGWGMTADISQPDYEIRLAILQQKLLDKKFALDNKIVEYLAENIQNNIRDLEGALNCIYVHSQLNKQELDLDEVKNILQSMSTIVPKSSLTTKRILQTVAEHYDVSVNNLSGSSRKKGLVVPRQVAMYLMREELEASFPNIGAELGGRDHTTAMHAHSKIVRELESSEKIKQDVILIKQKLYAG